MAEGRIGHLVAGVGAVLIFVFLFVDWFGAGGESRDAWRIFSAADIALCVFAVATLPVAPTPPPAPPPPPAPLQASSRPEPSAPPAPPATSSTPSVAPGWYPDPHGQVRLRWWDGSQWTDQTAD